MEHRSHLRSLLVAASLVAALALLPGVLEAQCTVSTTSTATVTQWRCLEQQITSGTTDFYSGGAGNPYRDLILRIAVTGNGLSFTQDAFWAADTANPKLFKFRVALPAAGPSTPATYTWSIAGCTGTTANINCASGIGWSPSTGTITVNGSTAGVNLYTKGFLTQTYFTVKTLPPTYVFSPLLYGDKATTFYWAADTVWSAPGFEASGQTSLWSDFVTDRKNKGINVLLVAPAATYAAFPANTGPFKPDAPATACSTALPNDTSIPNPAYWANFDNLINTANQSGIVPFIAGLLDPFDCGDPTNRLYPRQANAEDFARFLAARMAGFAVLYSPGFDDQLVALTADGVTTVEQVMNAVGAAIQQASPNQLVTNHLNGRATCNDYEKFRNAMWLTFFAFQSGHAFGPAQTGGTCPRAIDGTETSVNAALRRAWQMPWTLSPAPPLSQCPSSGCRVPTAYNAEGPYDNICLQTSTCTSCGTPAPGWCRPYDTSYGASYGANYIDIRYHNRQAAFQSLLSGAYGFTYGAQELGHWYFQLIPYASAKNGPAINDLTSVFRNFNSRAGMPAHRDWITNNGANPGYDGNFKKALASDGASLVLAYLPAGTTNTIDISTTNMPELACGAGWTYSWRHAQDNVSSLVGIRCSGTNPIQVTKPDAVLASECSLSYSPQSCDWVLQIQKTGSPIALSTGVEQVDVWADLSPEDGTSSIQAAFLHGTGDRDKPVVVSPAGTAFQQSPRVTRIPGGFLIIWHAVGIDGSMLGVFGQVLDHALQPAGPRLQINATAYEDQRDPAVDSDPFGNSLVVWGSYAQDGDLGGIYGRMIDRSGRPVTDELQINTTSTGHQEVPQVSWLPGGKFAVAWQTRPEGDSPGVVSFRVFDDEGRPVTDEFRFPGEAGAASRLIDVLGTPTGNLRLRWAIDGLDGSTHALFTREFTANGQPFGD